MLEEAKTVRVLSDMQQINVKHAQCLLRRGPIEHGYTSMSDDDDEEEGERDDSIVLFLLRGNKNTIPPAIIVERMLRL